jgi:hypothetical protein
MKLLPQTKIGKVSFWLVITGFIVIVLLNVIDEAAYCGKCPDGYRKEGGVCNPECYSEVRGFNAPPFRASTYESENAHGKCPCL